MKKVFLSVIAGLMGIYGSVSSQTIHIQEIQSEINQAFYASFAAGNTSSLTDIANRLKPDNLPLSTYWWAYSKYYEAVFYLKTNYRAKSEATVQEGIEVLSKLKGKNSEDYALLALMQNFSMQFIANVMKLGVLSGKVDENIGKAIKLNSNNLRAYYVAASCDFYTPEEYGGGKKAEEYLLKAITLDAQPVKDAGLPSWGKDQAYQMLISLYLKKGDRKSAKKYSDEAKILFPEKDWKIDDSQS